MAKLKRKMALIVGGSRVVLFVNIGKESNLMKFSELWGIVATA